MRKIEWQMSIGFPGAVRRGDLEVEDDATEQEIDDDVWAAGSERVEITWKEVE